MKNFLKLLAFFTIILSLTFSRANAAGEQQELLKVDWSFKSFFGKFDRASLQRGYQVYSEVCASCHSLKHLSYRNLAEKAIFNKIRNENTDKLVTIPIFRYSF